MNEPLPPLENVVEIRVRYQETDAQGRVHHANYINFFEIGRTELLRAGGKSYRELEEEGVMLVVSEMECRYFQGACYDDVLTVRTTTGKRTGVRIEHLYEVRRGEELLATGRTVIASIDQTGRPKRLPEWLRG